MKKINKIFTKRFWIAIYSVFLGLFTFVISKLNKKKYWLISERAHEARDNGYHLFSYIMNNFKNDKTYYAIKLKSNDLKKIQKFKNNVINFGSYKHWLIFWNSSILISTHIDGYVPNNDAYKLISKIFKAKGKKVFLQHGITKDNLPQLYYEKTKLDLFICGAKPEYEYIKNNFNYPDNIVKYTGLCRYDNLNNNNIKNIILVIPTFRMEFYVPSGEKINLTIEKKFVNSDFYNNYSKMLNDQKLNNILKKYNYKLYFYPHSEMQKYLKYFNSNLSNIKIVKSEDMDIQHLLKISKVMITDYSSVFFDFAYMNKKIYYFQFDKDVYRNKHYKAGYYDYVKNGFGEVFDNYNGLISTLKKDFNNDFEINDIYMKRINDFFKIRDNENCLRNYNEIINIEK